MAEELTIKVMGNAKDAALAFQGLRAHAEKSLSSMERSMNAAQRAIERDAERVRAALAEMFGDVEADRLIRELMQAGQAGVRAAQRIERALNGVEDELRQAQLRAAIFGNEMQKSSVEAQRAMNRVEQEAHEMGAAIRREATRAEQALERMGREGLEAGQDISRGAQQAQEELKETKQEAQETESRLKRLGEIDWGSLAGAGGGIAAGLGLAEAYEGIVNIDQGLARMRSSLDLTAKETEQMGIIARQVASETGQGWDMVFGAMTEVHRATGATGDELKTLTKDILGAQEALGHMGFEALEVTGSLKQIKTQWPGADERQALAGIVEMYRRWGDRANDVNDTIKEYGPDFQAAGFSADQFFSILDAGLQAGMMNTDKIADLFQEFFIQVNEDADETKEALDELFDSQKANQLFKDLEAGGPRAKKAFDEIMKALAGLQDRTERYNRIQELFGEIGKDNIDQLDRAIPLYAKISDEQYASAKSLDVLGSQWETTGSKMDRFFRDFEIGADKYLGGVADSIVNTLHDLGGWEVGITSILGGAGLAISKFGGTAWQVFRGISGPAGDAAKGIRGVGTAAAGATGSSEGFLASLGRWGTRLFGIVAPIVGVSAAVDRMSGENEEATEKVTAFRDALGSVQVWVQKLFGTYEPMISQQQIFRNEMHQTQLDLLQKWGQLPELVNDPVFQARFQAVQNTEAFKQEMNTAVQNLVDQTGIKMQQFPGKMNDPVFQAKLLMLNHATEIAKGWGATTDQINSITDQDMQALKQKIDSGTANARDRALYQLGMMQQDIKRELGYIPGHADSAMKRTADELESGMSSGKSKTVREARLMRVQTLDEMDRIPSPARSSGERAGSAYAKGLKSVRLPEPEFSFGTIVRRIAGALFQLPTLDLFWHKTGGVFTKPVVFGNAGFGDVEEAIVPFEGRHADRIAGLIAQSLNRIEQRSGEATVQVIFNNPVVREEQDIEEIVRRIQRVAEIRRFRTGGQYNGFFR